MTIGFGCPLTRLRPSEPLPSHLSWAHSSAVLDPSLVLVSLVNEWSFYGETNWSEEAPGKPSEWEVHGSLSKSKGFEETQKKPSDWQAREGKTLTGAGRVGKEDNRDVTREKGIRKEKKLLSWAEWGEQRSAGVLWSGKRRRVRLWRGDVGRGRGEEAVLAEGAWCTYGFQLPGGSLASRSPRCSLSAQARLWLALKHLNNGNHLRGGCIFSQDSGCGRQQF